MNIRKLDTFHYHEAHDRAFFLCEIYDVFKTHPVIAQHSEELRGHIDAVDLALGELYQKLASLNFASN